MAERIVLVTTDRLQHGHVRKTERQKLPFGYDKVWQEILEKTNSPTFLTLFNNILSVALFNYGN